MDQQNIYDDPHFFEGYGEFRKTNTGWNEALEQPAFYRMLPVLLSGYRVLDLGCRYGDLARRARMLGAAWVLGVDISDRMLDVARARGADPAIEYRRVAIEELQPVVDPFDIVLSSLALHYIEDYASAMIRIAALTKPGGHIIFSVEHPMMTALPQQEWHRDPDGILLHWPIDHYGEEGPRQTNWFVDGVIKYHRTVSGYVAGLLNADFRLTGIAEPIPSLADIKARPNLADHLRRPPFLLLSGERNEPRDVVDAATASV